MKNKKPIVITGRLVARTVAVLTLIIWPLLVFNAWRQGQPLELLPILIGVGSAILLLLTT